MWHDGFWLHKHRYFGGGAQFHPKVAEMPSQNSSQMRQKFYQGWSRKGHDQSQTNWSELVVKVIVQVDHIQWESIKEEEEMF